MRYAIAVILLAALWGIVLFASRGGDQPTPFVPPSPPAPAPCPYCEDYTALSARVGALESRPGTGDYAALSARIGALESRTVNVVSPKATHDSFTSDGVCYVLGADGKYREKK
jgi:hypothetical protein